MAAEKRTAGKSAGDKGTVPAQFQVEPRHLAALREEALRRTQERGTGRMDVSELVRESFDEWISKRGR